MRVIHKYIYGCTRDYEMTLYPLFDTHVGPRACAESVLKSKIDEIEQDDTAYWLGGGDYCDFVKMSDPRFDVTQLADWIGRDDLPVLADKQSERFCKYVEPIADKCLALAEGNHESAIKRHYEHDSYMSIVNGVKRAAGLPQEHRLALDYTGFVVLSFARSAESAKRREGVKTIKIFVHHGWGGGRFAGGRALNLERALMQYDADLILLGHTHDVDIKKRNIVATARFGIVGRTRFAVRCGTFLDTISYNSYPNYAEKSGYPALPPAGCEIKIRPYQERQIKVNFW